MQFSEDSFNNEFLPTDDSLEPNQYRVRLIGVNCPEDPKDGSPKQPFGPEAT